MFSGIVKGMGRIVAQTAIGPDMRMTVAFEDAGLATPPLGASMAVNGVCLTVAACREGRFEADLSAETLAVTTLAELGPGSRVNLEPSLRVGDSLDGHWVSGHVDGVGRVLSMKPAGRSVRLRIELPRELARYVARKGSIAVDGTSLTVNTVAGACFEVNIVPVTQAVTVISEYQPGRAVNIEVDIIARYLERLLGAEPGVNRDFLKTHGYTSEE